MRPQAGVGGEAPGAGQYWALNTGLVGVVPLCVGLTVLLEVFGSGESFLTESAGKPPLVGVCSPVPSQLGLGWKAPAAALVLARVRPLPRVEIVVGRQLTLLGKHLAAHLTCCLTDGGVVLNVVVEGAPGEVSCLTAGDGALQVGLQLLLVLLTPVYFSLSLCLELGLTFLTRKRKTSLVKLQMRVQVVDCSEVLVTALDVTAEILFTAVTQLMSVQFVPGHKGPATARNITLEGFDVVMRKEM